MTDSIRILLADDHPMVETAISTVLAKEADLVLISTVIDSQSAQQYCHELRPDVLLLDLNMPGPSPLDTVAFVQKHCPQTKVLVLTAYDSEVYIRSLVLAGVEGYILKNEAMGTIVQAIRRVVAGDIWYSRSVLIRLLNCTEKDPVAAQVHLLSKQEREILALIAEGISNKEIAYKLGLAEQTIRNYVSCVYSKLGLSSRAEAIVWARESDLIIS